MATMIFARDCQCQEKRDTPQNMLLIKKCSIVIIILWYNHFQMPLFSIRHGMAHGQISVLHGSKVIHELLYRMGKPQDLLKITEDKDGLIPEDLHFSRRLRV